MLDRISRGRVPRSMTYATSSSLHVRIPARRSIQSSVRRIVIKTLIGLAAVATALVAIIAVVIGAGRLLTSTVEPRSDVRSASVFAEPSSWQAWNARSNVGATAQLAVIAGLSLPATRPSPVPEPTAALALASPGTPDEAVPEPDVTGSLDTPVFRLASTDVAADMPSGLRSARPDTQLSPLPRPRPQLAALTPPGDLGIKQNPDARLLRTAIYDITAQTVYLPNGERLEAHSGLGRFMDNPLHVHRKNHGATPPNTYRLTLRESLFHGVQAIRLTPENETDMFGRDGILAHSYMLGPSGQSNGCVSFRDYPKFLRAFLRGEFDRMIVVRRLDKSPTSFARRDVRAASTTF